MPKQPDMGTLLKQAQQMQEQLMAAQAEAAEQEVTGQAGGGVVKVTATGAGEIRAVEINPDVVDPTEVEMLEDLVLAAVSDAMAQVHELQSQSMGALGDLGGGLGGLLGG